MSIRVLPVFLLICAFLSPSARAHAETAEFKTNRGDFKVRLFTEQAPKACENFIRLAEQGYYDNLVFHRVIKEFMIQGGDPTGTGAGGKSVWGEPFEDEIRPDLQFDRPGLLAMANAGARTNGSQFFVTVAPTPFLHGKHTIFGEVISGYETVHAISQAPTAGRDRPIEDQRILAVRIKK